MPQKRDRNSEFAITLRERLIELRTKKFNLTQAEFAKYVGISTSSVGLYETGERVPDAENLFKICKACNVTSDFLMGLEKESVKNCEVRAICEYTGLSSNNVVLLHDCKICGGSDKEFLDLLNFSLQNKYFGKAKELFINYIAHIKLIQNKYIPHLNRLLEIDEQEDAEKALNTQIEISSNHSRIEIEHRIAMSYYHEAVDSIKKALEDYASDNFDKEMEKINSLIIERFDTISKTVGIYETAHYKFIKDIISSLTLPEPPSSENVLQTASNLLPYYDEYLKQAYRP